MKPKTKPASGLMQLASKGIGDLILFDLDDAEKFREWAEDQEKTSDTYKHILNRWIDHYKFDPFSIEAQTGQIKTKPFLISSDFFTKVYKKVNSFK